MLGPQREHHRVVVGRRLELEVERDAEALAQCQAEGAVDASAERCVQDELRSFAVVEATFHHNALTGGQVAERRQSGGTVGHHLLCHVVRRRRPAP